MTATSDEHPHTGHELDSAATSLGVGLMRLWRARIVYTSIMLGFSLLNSKDATPDEQALNAVAALRNVSMEELDAYSYINAISELVYVTTLLDSFLSDITMFLFLLHPHSIGDQQSISLGDLLSATSRVELINATATKRVREISFLPFVARIDFLRERFGLHISLDAEIIELLGHFATVRNVLVHDQSIFDVLLNDNGKICVKQVRCPRHPTPISPEDPKKAQNAFREVAAAVYEAVCLQVLKRHDEPFVENFIRVLRKPL